MRARSAFRRLREGSERERAREGIDAGESTLDGSATSTLRDRRAQPSPPTCAECRQGHGDEGLIRLDRSAFNHHQARFDLRGAHRSLACERCHESLVYRPLPTDCADCHEDAGKVLGGELGAVADDGAPAKPDPHAGRTRCTDCHTPTPGPAGVARMANRCVECHAPSYGVLHQDRVRQLNLLLTRTRDPEAARPARRAGHNFLLVSRRLHELIGNKATDR